MRLRRLTLHHVRGIEHRTVDLTHNGDPTGVIIVEGPNEAGKSTLAFAFHQLLRSKAGANTAGVRSLASAGSDEGACVEAEFELGGHRLVYTKRFLRGRTTELRFLDADGGLTGEVLSGDEAHQRVNELLEEHLDRELWESLRLRQGDGLDAPELDRKPGLTKVLGDLDDAGAIGAMETGILERAQKEYERYWTKQAGSPTNELRAAQQQAADADTRARDIDARYQTLAGDIAEVDRLRQALPGLRTTAERASAVAEELEAELQRVAALRILAGQRHREAELAAEKLRAAQQAQQRRDELSQDHDRLEVEQAEVAADLAELRQDEEEARVRAVAATEQLELVQQRARDAVTRRQLAQDDLDHLRLRRETTELRTRFGRAEEADARARDAAARRDAIRVGRDAIERIRTASHRLAVARAALDAAVPHLRLTARRQLDIEFGAETVALDTGEEQSWSITDSLEVRIPDVVDLEIRPGDSIEASRDAERIARTQLEEELAQAGQPTLEAAEAAAAERATAHEDLGQAEAERDAILGDATLDELRTQVQHAEDRLRAYLDTRADTVPIPDDEAAAQRDLDEAKAADDATTAELAESNQSYAAAKEEHERCRLTAGARDEALGAIRQNLERTREQLGGARATEPDAGLADRVSNLIVEVDGRTAAAVAVQQELDEVEAEGLEARADNAAQVARDARHSLEQTDRTIVQLEASIRALGADGIGEQRAEANAARQRAQAELAGVQRRADAARRLVEVLSEQRTRAQERYAAPLRERIVGYGRVLHGPGFDVELDAQLAITRRRADDLWLEVSALSAGAQEQLALLSRLACAALLAQDGGVLLIDDALGNTDPERLERLGAVIRAAGQQSQIVIFTCYPQRYVHVGGAKRISVRRAAPTPDRDRDDHAVGDASPGDDAPTPSMSTAGASDTASGPVETLTCEACGRAWTRTVVRGRKPSRCTDCR